MGDVGWSRGAPRTLVEVLEQRVAADPDGPFLDLAGTGLSAAAFDDATARLAAGLADLGVGAGDRVATLLENGPAAVLAIFAAVRLGAVAVPVNTAYKGEFLAHQLGDSGSKVLVVQGSGFNWPKPDHFRIVFLPNADDLTEAISRIAKFLDHYHRRHA